MWSYTTLERQRAAVEIVITPVPSQVAEPCQPQKAGGHQSPAGWSRLRAPPVCGSLPCSSMIGINLLIIPSS
jgi:hypothetical protein